MPFSACRKLKFQDGAELSQSLTGNKPLQASDGCIVTYSNAPAKLLQCFGPDQKQGRGEPQQLESNSKLPLVLIFSSNYPIFHGIIFIFLKLWTVQISGRKIPRCLCFKKPYAALHDIFSPLGCLRASLHQSLQKQMYAWHQFFKAWPKPWQIICVIFQSEAVLAQAPWPCYVRTTAIEAAWKQSDHEAEQIYCSSSLLPPEKISKLSPCHWIVLT